MDSFLLQQKNNKTKILSIIGLVSALLAVVGAGVWFFVDTPSTTTPSFVAFKRPRAMYHYAHPQNIAFKKEDSYVSFVVLGAGHNHDLTRQALKEFPPEVAFSLSPFLPQAKKWAHEIWQEKREILVTIPLEPDSFPSNDPGPNTLMTCLSGEENIERLNWALRQVPNAVGLTHDTGDHFTTDSKALEAILQHTRRLGFFFVDTCLSPESMVSSVAPQQGCPYILTSYFLKNSAKSMEKELRRIEILAKEEKFVTIVVYLTPIAFRVLKDWFKELPEKNIRLLRLPQAFKEGMRKDFT